MNNQLKKTFFNKKTTCLLTGLQDYQFDYFVKQADMIENKLRYSLNDVIYIKINSLFKENRLTWVEIKNLYIECFGSIENFRNIDFLQYSQVYINHDGKNSFYVFHPKNEIMDKTILKIEGSSHDFIADDDVFVGKKTRIIHFYKIIDKIIKKSKELNLKVDVEHILLSA